MRCGASVHATNATKKLRQTFALVLLVLQLPQQLFCEAKSQQNALQVLQLEQSQPYQRVQFAVALEGLRPFVGLVPP